LEKVLQKYKLSTKKNEISGCRTKNSIGICSFHAYAMLLSLEESEKIAVTGAWLCRTVIVWVMSKTADLEGTRFAAASF
jgi:hypothetical protein